LGIEGADFRRCPGQGSQLQAAQERSQQNNQHDRGNQNAQNGPRNQSSFGLGAARARFFFDKRFQQFGVGALSFGDPQAG